MSYVRNIMQEQADVRSSLGKEYLWGKKTTTILLVPSEHEKVMVNTLARKCNLSAAAQTHGNLWAHISTGNYQQPKQLQLSRQL